MQPVGARLGTLIIKDPPDSLKENKYWKRGHNAAKEGQGKEVNPYKLDEEIWAKLRKRTYWLMGYEDYIFSAKAAEIRRDELRRMKKEEKKKRKREEEKQQRKEEKRREKHGHHRHHKRR